MDESGGSGRPRSDGAEGLRPDGAHGSPEPARPVDTADEPARRAETDRDPERPTDAAGAPEAPRHPSDEPARPRDDNTNTSTGPDASASPDTSAGTGTSAGPDAFVGTSTSVGTGAPESPDASSGTGTSAGPDASVGTSTSAGTGAPESPGTSAGPRTSTDPDAPAAPDASTSPATSPAPDTPAAEPRREQGPVEQGPDGQRPGESRPVLTKVGPREQSSGKGNPAPPGNRKGPGGGLLMGRPFGVPVYVAPSWFLVAALITWVFGDQLDRVLPELGGARYLVSLFFAVAFYASVLVHELAHTVAALRFKLPVRRIQLQFFGGVSEIEKESETPGREFVLAFVGPLLSLVLAGVFYAGMQAVDPGTVPGVLLAGLMISNLIVAAFNLLPGLPLDGGRMLRAVVWKITGRPMSGTVAAAWVGRALAISVLIGLPLLNQSGALGGDAQDIGGMDTVMDALLAAILAAIIWTGAGNSLRMARLREHLPELRARTLTRRAVPVEGDTPLSEALRRANDAGARALVVVDADGDPMAVVREAAIVSVPQHRRPWVGVGGLAQDITEGMRVSAELAGEELLDTLRTTPATEYLVVEESGEIYGVLSAADVERAFVKAMARPS
ncbi:site-2 protease family protein [Streptomyces sp. NPDC005562]|uniref:site-2 protease family protein n=1 Tax=Streptomyces sp. NPDC005562 TaxID=3154890 RepID=UPI0033B71F59